MGDGIGKNGASVGNHCGWCRVGYYGARVGILVNGGWDIVGYYGD